jgi:hypothetical protein
MLDIDVATRAKAREAPDKIPNPQETYLNQYGTKTRKERTIGKADHIHDVLKKQQAADVSPAGRNVTPETLGLLWQKWATRFNPEVLPFSPALTIADKGKLRRPITVWKAASQDPNAVLRTVLSNWLAFTKHVQGMQDLKSLPLAPSIPFTVKWANEALSFYMKSGEKKLAVVVEMKKPVPPSVVVPVVEAIRAEAKTVKVEDEDHVASLEEIIAIEKAVRGG